MRLSIRAKQLFFMIMLPFVPLALIFTWGVSYFYTDKKTYIADLNAQVAGQVAQAVRGNLSHLREIMDSIVVTHFSQDLTPAERDRLIRGRFFGSKQGRENPNLTFNILLGEEKLLELHNEDFLGQLGSEGAKLKSVMPALLTGLTAEDAGFLKVVNSTRSPALPTAALMTVYPGSEGEEVAVAVMEVVADSLLEAEEAAIYTTYLVDSNGRILAHPDRDKVLQRRSVSHLDIVKPLLDVGRGIAGQAEFTDEEGREMVGAWARVGLGGAGVVLQTEKEKAFAALQQLVKRSSVAVAALLLFVAVVAVFFSRSLTKPLLALSRVSAEVAKGNFDVAIAIDSRDEIGDLAGSFRKMQEGLTERDRKIKDAREQLVQSEKMGALGQLAAGITHEVKNPMAGIIGFAQLRRRTAEKGTTQEKYLNLIEKESKRALEILQNLLKFARKDKMEMEGMGVNDLLEESIRLVAHQLSIKGVKIFKSLAEGLPPMMGSMNQLQQVLLNMMINAQHAMEKTEKKELHVASQSDSETGGTIISIRDTGCGIKDEDKSKIFTPFFTTKETGKGTGLGMSMCYGIMQQHKGTITFDSQVGVGTTFFLKFPPASALSAAAQTKPAEAAAAPPA